MALKKKHKKIILICSCVCLSIIVLFSGLLVYVYFNENIVKNYAQEWISKRLDASVEIGSLGYSLFPFRIQAKDLHFGMDDARGRIRLSIDEVEGRGDLISFLRRGGRALDVVEVYGLELDAHIKEAKDKKTGAFNLDDLSEQLSPLIKGVSRMNLNEMSINLTSYQGQNLNLQDADLIVLTRSSGDGLDFSFSNGEYKVRDTSLIFEAEGTLKLTGHLNLRQFPRLEAEIYVENKTFSSSQTDLFFFPGRFVFSTLCETDLENRIDLHDLSVNIPQICELSGILKMDLTDFFSISFNSHIKLPEIKNVLVKMSPYLPYFLSSLDINGSAEIDLTGSLQKRGAEFDYGLDGRLILPSSHFSMTYEEVYSTAFLSADLSINASKNHEEFNGNLKIVRGLIKGKNWECKGLDLKLPLSGSQAHLTISGLDGTLDEFSYFEKKRIFNQNEIKIKGTAAVDIKNKALKTENLKLTLSALGTFDLKASYSPEPHKRSFFSLNSADLKISEVLNSFNTFIPDELLTWEPEGKLSIKIEAQTSVSDAFKIATNIDLEELSFHDPPFSVAGESISLEFSVENEWVPGGPRIPFSLKFSLTQGETLLKNFYVKWADQTLQSQIHGQVDTIKKSINIDAFDLIADSLGEIHGGGQIILRDSFDVDLSMTVSRVDPVRIGNFLDAEVDDDPLKVQIRGEGEFQIDLRKRGRYLSLKGNAGFHNGFFYDPSKNIQVSGVEIEFPFFLDIGFPRPPGWIDFWFKRGTLELGQIQVNDLKMEGIDLEVLAARNIILFKPVQIELFGGTASIYEAVGQFNRLQRDFSANMAFLLRDGKIESLIPEQQDLPLTGSFGIDMPGISINKRKISTKGQIQVEIFQGTARVSNIEIDRPFSKNRTLLCDIEFKNFNLKKVTDSLPFGQVTGFVEGKVENLAVSYGQPEQFSLWIDSVDKKGVPKRFSMKAVDDISILSSGKKTSMGSVELLSTFVSSFRYKKIGIFCSLQNDVFTLRGTIREKAKELMVKKDWIFGISVVNAEPDNQISFKDMLSRLNRIGKSQ